MPVRNVESTSRSPLTDSALGTERFLGALKRERVNLGHYRTRAEARAGILDDIKRHHNPRQRQSLEWQQQEERLLTQPSVISRWKPPSSRGGRLKYLSRRPDS